MLLNMGRMQQLVERGKSQADREEIIRRLEVVDNVIAQQEEYPKLKELLALPQELSTTQRSTPRH